MKPDETGFQQSPWQLPSGGPGIESVLAPVHQSIEGHGRASRSHHGSNDPETGLAPGQPALGQKGSQKSKGQGEDGVLELDHLQRKHQSSHESARL